MKKIGLVLGVLTILALLAGVALADCAQDCQDTYATCMKYCSQDTCRLSCIRGLDGCLKRCEAKNKKSENTRDCTVGYLPAAGDLVAGDKSIVLASSCIEKDLQCTLNGTPCCAPYECKGKFPNTYCQEK